MKRTFASIRTMFDNAEIDSDTMDDMMNELDLMNRDGIEIEDDDQATKESNTMATVTPVTTKKSEMVERTFDTIGEFICILTSIEDEGLLAAADDILGEAVYSLADIKYEPDLVIADLRKLSTLFGRLHDLTLEQAVEMTVTQQCRVVDEGRDFVFPTNLEA